MLLEHLQEFFPPFFAFAVLVTVFLDVSSFNENNLSKKTKFIFNLV